MPSHGCRVETSGKKTNTDNRNAAPAAGRKATRQVCITVDLQSAKCFLTSPCILFLTSGPSCEQRGGNRATSCIHRISMWQWASDPKISIQRQLYVGRGLGHSIMEFNCSWPRASTSPSRHYWGQTFSPDCVLILAFSLVCLVYIVGAPMVCCLKESRVIRLPARWIAQNIVH